MAELRAWRAERTPLFISVGAALKREIAAGRFAQADLLPGERELSQMLDVSRTTLRRAIAELVDEGVLVHRHGAGTFVRRNPPHVEQPLSRLTSFTEDMRLRGLAPSSKVIERGTFLPTPEESMMLDIALAEPVFRLERLRLADGVPMALERAAVPLRFLDGAEPGGESLYSALEAAGFRPVRAIERLRAVVVGAAEAALLGVPKARGARIFIALPTPPMAGGSNSPAAPSARTRMISSPSSLWPPAPACEAKERSDDLDGDGNRRNRRSGPAATRGQRARRSGPCGGTAGRRPVLCRDNRARKLRPRRPVSQACRRAQGRTGLRFARAFDRLALSRPAAPRARRRSHHFSVGPQPRHPRYAAGGETGGRHDDRTRQRRRFARRARRGRVLPFMRAKNAPSPPRSR